MRKHVFRRIVEALENWSPFFTQRSDVVGHIGFSPLQKCSAAIRMLATGCAADGVDDLFRIGASTRSEERR